MFVPSAPGDAGLPVGAAWLFHPPLHSAGPELAYGGPLLFGLENLAAEAERRGAQLARADEIAQFLSRRLIVGVLRGRTEVGPRALGHRSLIAYPDSEAIKASLNRLKGREWCAVALVFGPLSLGCLRRPRMMSFRHALSMMGCQD